MFFIGTKMIKDKNEYKMISNTKVVKNDFVSIITNIFPLLLIKNPKIANIINGKYSFLLINKLKIIIYTTKGFSQTFNVMFSSMTLV